MHCTGRVIRIKPRTIRGRLSELTFYSSIDVDSSSEKLDT